MQGDLERSSMTDPGRPAHKADPLPTPQGGSGIPVPLTPLVGRTSELDYIQQVLKQRATRLLVLTGPGGVGKTRLALSAAHAVAEHFRGGFAGINLSSVTMIDKVIPAIADAIGVRGDHVDSLFHAIVDALHEKDILLVLDNFEQVVGAAPLLTDLLRATTGVTILATSRSVLGVYGESVFPVSPFRVPPAGETSVERISRFEAVQLFVSRVRALRPRFHLNERNAQDVAMICRRLDGIPLAIELAAARASLFTVADIAQRLEMRLPVLEPGPSNVPDRYCTMRSAIDWSYDLLSPFEQQVLRHLSLFAGAWNLRAAAAIMYGMTSMSLDEEIALLDAIGSLVDKSLVQRLDTIDHDRTFQMLQVVRDYGRDALEAHSEREAAEERHMLYILDFSRRATPHLTGRDQVTWFDQLDALEADISLAFERLLETGRPGMALELMANVWRYAYARGNILEYRTKLERALSRSTTQDKYRAKALNGAGVLSNMLGDMEKTERYHTEALELGRQLGDKHYMGMALFGLGDLATHKDNDVVAEQNYLEAERLYTELDNTRGIATAQTNLGNLYWKQGRLQEARKINEAARRLYDIVGDQRGLAWSYTNVGRLSAELREYGHAAANLSAAMKLYDTIGDRTGISETLEGYALINLGMRDYTRAVRLLGAANRLRTEIAHPVPLNDRASMERMVQTLRRELGDAYDDAFHDGEAIDLNDAIALAVNINVPADTGPRISTSDAEVRAVLQDMGITDRELEVLVRLGAGESDKHIADELFISVRTVQSHVQNLLSKFDVTSRSAAVAKAFRIGLLQ
jgi:predicted ATPase/DNA-binding CsgD family transcriptional regulator